MAADPEYIQYVRNHLGDTNRLTAAQRDAAFVRARENLRDHYWEQGFSKEDYDRAAQSLQEAIFQLRDEVHVQEKAPIRGEALAPKAPVENKVHDLGKQGKAKSSPVDRAIGAIQDMWGHIDVKFGALVAAIILISDFLTPILALTKYIAVGAGIATLVLLVLARSAPSSRKFPVHVAASFCALLFVCSAGCLGLQNSFRDAGATGIIAQVVPGTTALQNTLLASLSRGERRTSESVEQKQPTDDKETGSSPRKELADMGISWEARNFGLALMAGNRRTVELFLQGGMALDRYLSANFIARWFRPEIAELLVAYKMRVDQAICTEDTLRIPGYPLGIWLQSEFIKNNMTDPQRRDFYFSVCDPSAIRARYEQRAQEIRDAISGYDDLVKKQEQQKGVCITELRSKYLPVKSNTPESDVESMAQEAYLEAIGKTRQQSSTMSAQLQASEMANRLRGILSTVNRGPPDTKVGHVIQQGCTEAFEKPLPTDPAKLRDVQEVLGLVPT